MILHLLSLALAAAASGPSTPLSHDDPIKAPLEAEIARAEHMRVEADRIEMAAYDAAEKKLNTASRAVPDLPVDPRESDKLRRSRIVELNQTFGALKSGPSSAGEVTRLKFYRARFQFLRENWDLYLETIPKAP